MLDSELSNNGNENTPVAKGETGSEAREAAAEGSGNSSAHSGRPATSSGPAFSSEEPEPVPVPVVAIPAVFFQPPQVLFQPPQPFTPPVGPPPAAGNGSGAAAPEDEAPAGASERTTGRRSAGRASRTRSASQAREPREPRDSREHDLPEAYGSQAEDEDALAALAGPAEPVAAPADIVATDEEDAEEVAGSRRRRRRDRRSRGRAEAEFSVVDRGASVEAADEATDAEADADGDDDAGLGEEGGDGSLTSRRRRRKRRRGTADADVIAPDDPPDTVVHVREPHNLVDDVRSVKGSTRLEAKKQRRREGRESGRRRPPVVTESEFLARRESVERAMLVRQRGDRTQIAVLEDGVLVEHYVNRTTHQSYVGNVYLGKVQNVLPSMEAAFVDIGKGRNAVLYAGEVNFEASGLEGQPKRIESALKPGQSVIVQVTKDPVGHKGARLTSQVSLPGRYLVYVPGASMTGISRKLPDTERNRLKHILKKVTPEHAGVIVRTAAEGAAEAELERDVTRLAAQWENIERKAKTASAPALLYGEPDLTIRVVRDVFNEDFSKLIVSGDEGWEIIDEYVRYVAPHLAERVERWGPEIDSGGSAMHADDVFAAYRVDEQLAKALERKVWLPSGGSLIIDRTEAMTVIDVNTGKFTGQGGNLEETVTRNNLEAAEEIVRQLRLRDVGGIVVIDFIDMVLEANRDLVLRRLLECLARDRTKHQVAEVTSLGLVQMTRKRVGAGLLEAFSEPCEHCNGRGVMLHFEPTEASSHHAPRRGAGNGSGGAASGNGTAGHGGEHNGRRDLATGTDGGAALGGDTDSGSGAAAQAGTRGAGQAERGGRRNRRDRDRGTRHGSATVVANAIADVASATLVPADAEVLSVEAPAAIDETAVTGRQAGGARQRAATRTAAGPVASDSLADVATSAPQAAEASQPAEVPVADVPPAPPRRRTRTGSASVRRVTTSSEPATVVVAAAPVTDSAPAPSEPAPAAQPAAAPEAAPVVEPAPAAEAAAEPAATPEAVAAAEPAPSAEAGPVVADVAPVDVDPVDVEPTDVAVDVEPAVEAAPAEVVPEAAEVSPVTVESLAEVAPVVEAEPAAVVEPAAPEPAAATEPAAAPEPEPLAVVEPEPGIEPAAVAELMALPAQADLASDAPVQPGQAELGADDEAALAGEASLSGEEAAEPQPDAQSQPEAESNADSQPVAEPVTAAVAELPAGQDAATAWPDDQPGYPDEDDGSSYRS